MGLKQSIVIVNEFTVKTAKGGTRGGTPGDYVTRYMSRNGAVEDLTPVRRDTENFITRYMARADAVDNAESVSDLKSKMRGIQGSGGVAFGYGDFSLSDKKLQQSARDIQKCFDGGKTVMKTVLSFDEEYLRKYNIIQPDFEFRSDGDYRGNIDQMKLRMSIMNGLDKLSKQYDDLQYVGVIQVDTRHVHCHLAMVDRGTGHIMPDGTQRGKLTNKDKDVLRRGIDTYLDEKQTVKMMSANVEQDRRNTVCFVKKYTHQAVNNRNFSQFLLACLPEDKSLWRAKSNRKDMQKPNAIVKQYVTQLLQQPDSGYKEALQAVDTYAKSRAVSEDMSGREYRELYQRGHDKIIEQSMNSVYSVLKQIPDEERTVQTDMLDVMSMPYEAMASSAETSSVMEFGFKLRSYKTRLDHHKHEMQKYHDAAKNYEKQESDETSRPLYDYFKVEEEYNAMLLAKYQHFLHFIPQDDDYMQEFDELMSRSKRIENLERMKDDPTVFRMNEQGAENYCLRVYNESGGHYLLHDPEVIDSRLEILKTGYNDMRDDYIVKLRGYGLNLTNENHIERGIQYDFDDVKALDLHHLLYDFPHDLSVSNDNSNKFIAMADRRKDAFDKAADYLRRSGQGDMISNLPEADIKLQTSVANHFRQGGQLYSRRDGIAADRTPVRTVRIDSPVFDRQEEAIKDMIRTTINSLQYE